MYATKQRKILLDYLEEHADEAISAGKLAEALKESGISVSAIYRNLAAFEKEGSLVPESVNKTNEKQFRYIGAKKCHNKLHLSCKECGHTFHMDAKSADSLVDAISSLSDFSLDKSETVLYGICHNCKHANERS